MTPIPMRPVVLAMCLAICSIAVQGARAQTQPQSDSDLRRQNQQLASRIQDLEKQLQEAEDRIKQLEQQLATAAKPPAGTATTAPPPVEERISIDETVPNASPRALHRALIASYEKDPAKLEMGRQGDGKRRAYLRRLEGWKGMVEREFRGPIKWHVKVIGPGDPPFANGNEIIRFVAVDPASGVQLGDPFDVSLTRTLSDRISSLEARDELDVLVLRGILHPIVIINEDRSNRGSFDHPPFIGPFAEMDFSITVQSLVPPKDDDKDKAPVTKPAPTPAPARSTPPGRAAEKP